MAFWFRGKHWASLRCLHIRAGENPGPAAEWLCRADYTGYQRVRFSRGADSAFQPGMVDMPDRNVRKGWPVYVVGNRQTHRRLSIPE